jgi:uncharacterized protein YjiS (DUF1127 family)
MVMIMNTTFRAAGEVRAATGKSLRTAFVKRAWRDCTIWRRERAAVVGLRSTSKRELRDAGLTRCDVATAGRGGGPPPE